ncbi:MAG: MFS transporter [Mycobacteriales bacterium]
MLEAISARVLPRSARTGAVRHTLLWTMFAVYALDRADRTLVGAVAPSLKHAFSLNNTQIGELGTAYTIVSALATVPAGALTDRLPRTRLLAGALVLWAVAMISTGAAVTFGILLASRAFLGVVQAAAGPAVPSLTGDVVDASQRSQAMAVVDSGQLVGIGLGYVVAGAASALLGWRWAFLSLSPLALLLAVRLWRNREPARAVRHDGAERLSLWRAAKVVLRVRTNVLAIFASGIGQYFFAGLSTFTVVYVTEQYRISQAQADLGLPAIAVAALGGLFGGAWLADRLRERGHHTARLWVAGVSYVLAAVFAVPAIVTRSVWLAVPAIMVGVAFLNAATPTLDALRLDVIRPDLRGRSEAIRTLVLTGFEGSAPLVFGLLADRLAGGGRLGLEYTFLLTLPTVVLSGLLVVAAIPFYAREARAEAETDLQSDDPEVSG